MRGSADASPISSSLIAFKPRQVLLLQQKQRNQSASTPMAQLNADNESTLVFSVALWIKNKGFSKVLKRFLAEAQIKDDDWMTKALNLNEIFSKYQEICNSASKDFKFQAKKEEHVAGDANGAASEEIKEKKKKKKSKVESAVDKSGKTLEDTTMTEKINESRENGGEDESFKVSKKSNGNDVPELAEDQPTKKPKEKKKKKSKLVAQDTVEDEVDESKKASKKRKRMAPDENENQPGEEAAVEESKSKKSKGLEESKDVAPHTAFVGANGHAIEQENATNDNEMDKSVQKKSANKQPKSSEPTAVKAFQRVKIDEVKFVDERLQDNSYWAKDGADIGYGAKAQEVLGQVKGRGFRHEKTKKKRGSYRGGQIDLQSHSIKFKDSDEE